MFDEKLGKALNFTEEDLIANRDGYMTKVQRKRLRRDETVDVICLIFIAALVEFAYLVTVWFNFQTKPIGMIPLMVGGLVCLVGFYMLFPYHRWRNLKADLYKGGVSFVEGNIKLDIIGRDPLYKLKIHKRTFNISKSLLLALRNGDSYRIYITPHTRRILSVESIDEPQ